MITKFWVGLEIDVLFLFIKKCCIYHIVYLRNLSKEIFFFSSRDRTCVPPFDKGSYCLMWCALQLGHKDCHSKQVSIFPLCLKKKIKLLNNVGKNDYPLPQGFHLNSTHDAFSLIWAWKKKLVLLFLWALHQDFSAFFFSLSLSPPPIPSICFISFTFLPPLPPFLGWEFQYFAVEMPFVFKNVSILKRTNFSLIVAK